MGLIVIVFTGTTLLSLAVLRLTLYVYAVGIGLIVIVFTGTTLLSLSLALLRLTLSVYAVGVGLTVLSSMSSGGRTGAGGRTPGAEDSPHPGTALQVSPGPVLHS